MKKLLFLILAIALTTSSFAQQLNGIRVESPVPVVVFVNGQRMSSPTQTFFITGLNRGYYTIEAFTAVPSGRGGVIEERVFSGRIDYSGRGVQNVIVTDCGVDHNRPGVGGDPNYRPNDRPNYNNVMTDREFTDFLSRIRRAPFAKDKTAEVRRAAANGNTNFTASQVATVMKCFDFDSGRLDIAKMLYPQVIDPRNTGIITEAFDFSSNKNSFDRFVENYNRQRR